MYVKSDCLTSPHIPNSSSTGGKKQVMLNLYRLKLADCLDDSNVLQETQEYAGNIQTLLTEFSEYETLLSGTKLICGCTNVGDIVPTWADILTWDRDCKQLIIYLEGLKKSISTNKSIQNYPRGVSAIGQIKIGDVCIDKVYIHTQESPTFEVLLPSKKKTTMGVEFDISNSINKFKIDIQDTEAKDAKIDAVWKYLNGEGTKNISFTGELDEVLLKKIFPQVDNEDSKKILPFMNKYLLEFGITSCEERIHFFTQIAEETTQLKDLSELPSDYASSQSKYKGRGLMQLTSWEYNYKPFETYCKEQGDEVDFENHPEEVATNPKYAVLSAFWYWKIEKKCSRYCSDLSEESLLKVSKLVNCGNTEFCSYKKNPNTGVREKCYDCEPNGWSKRKKEFERLKGLFPCE